MHISKKKNEYIELAKKLAVRSEVTASKHGAVLVMGNKIIGMGYNRYSTNNKKRLTIHAEVSAIIDAFKKKIHDFSNATLYVIRISNKCHCELQMSKPCKLCTPFINKMRINRVYYSV